MTLPNIITLFRLFLIPGFVMCVLYYVDAFHQGHGNEMLRWWAAALFIVAAISDGVDGFLARRLNQRSELGAVLDPLADKLLQVTALVLLAWDFDGAFHRIPIWLPIVVVTRDLFVLAGFVILRLVYGTRMEVRAHRSGKAATALTMVLIAMVLLKWTDNPFYPVVLYGAGLCVLASLAVYIRRGLRRVDQIRPAA